MVGIVSHDAGGAEILSSWALRAQEPYCLVLDGPAIGIFQRKLGKCVSVELDKLIEQSDWLLCGTSWASDLERRAIRHAHCAGKKVVAYLDHWVNYKERFQSDGDGDALPDEIWVGDDYAYDIAVKRIPEVPVRLQVNPYIEDLQQRITSLTPRGFDSGSDFADVLYVCEPIREHALLQHGNERHWGYTEEDALRYFLNHIHLLGIEDPQVKVRLHPSEKKGKYDWVPQGTQVRVSISEEPDLLTDIMSANVVVGCTSMAMFVGVLAGKRVVSVIPPGGESCSIPYREIEHMQALVSRSELG